MQHLYLGNLKLDGKCGNPHSSHHYALRFQAANKLVAARLIPAAQRFSVRRMSQRS